MTTPIPVVTTASTTSVSSSTSSSGSSLVLNSSSTTSKQAESKDAQPKQELLQVCDEEMCLEQCSDDPEFMIDLLNEFLNDQARVTKQLTDAISANDHKTFKEVSHSIKGSALQLYLPALSHEFKAAEDVGRGLLENATNDTLLSKRAPLLKNIDREYGRLKEWMANRKS